MYINHNLPTVLVVNHNLLINIYILIWNKIEEKDTHTSIHTHITHTISTHTALDRPPNTNIQTRNTHTNALTSTHINIFRLTRYRANVNLFIILRYYIIGIQA